MQSLDAIKDEEGNVDQIQTRPEVLESLFNLNDKIDRVTKTQIDPVWFREGLIAIRGLSIDNTPVETIPLNKLVDLLPEQLYREILKSIRSNSELTMEERQNLEYATTSAERVDSKINSITADSAAKTDSTNPETVASTSQTK